MLNSLKMSTTNAQMFIVYGKLFGFQVAQSIACSSREVRLKENDFLHFKELMRKRGKNI